MVVVIEKDFIADVENGDVSRVGFRIYEKPLTGRERVTLAIIGEENPQLTDGLDGFPAIKFRLRDEDMEIHYEGVLSDDPDCLNQEAAAAFGEADTGAFICEVWRNEEWTQEIA